MKTIIIMIGLQGSGKSEYCRRYLSEGFVRVNLDTLHTRVNEWALLERCFSEGAGSGLGVTGAGVGVSGAGVGVTGAGVGVTGAAVGVGEGVTFSFTER